MAEADEKVVIPEDLKTQCLMCKGTGSKKVPAFTQNCGPVTKQCDLCKGQKWVWALNQQEMAERIARAEAEVKALREQVEQFQYGDNYIKKFLDAKDKCAAMYPPEEVYTKGQLEWWAEENGYALIASRK